MKYGLSLTLLRFILGFAIAQEALPSLVPGVDGVHREVRLESKRTITASELMALVPVPKPEDVASPRALVLALHDSISGPVGPFNWDRFRSLFLPTAGVGEAGKGPGGKLHIMFQPVNDWILSVKAERPKVSVHETVYKVRIEQFGNIASAFYSHNSVTSEHGGTDIRRVNICQMLYDGKRWWIASVVWNVSPKNWDLPRNLEP